MSRVHTRVTKEVSLRGLFRRTVRFFSFRIFGRLSGHYGHGSILREYIKYPFFLPVNVQIQHGWYSNAIPDIAKLYRIPVMLTWSRRMAEEWKRHSTKPVYVLGAPFVHYRRMHQIEKNPRHGAPLCFPTIRPPISKRYMTLKSTVISCRLFRLSETHYRVPALPRHGYLRCSL